MKKTLAVIVFLASAFFCFSSAHAVDLGNGEFVFIGNVVKAPGKNAGYIISESQVDTEHKLGAAGLQANKKLSSTLAKIASLDDPTARFSGKWLINGNKKELDPASLKVESVRGEKDCPDRIFSKHTITGTFMGTECGDFCHTTIKGRDGAELTMYGDTEELFGEKPGPKVSIEYQLAQAWLDTGDWGVCVIGEFFVSGKKIK